MRSNYPVICLIWCFRMFWHRIIYIICFFSGEGGAVRIVILKVRKSNFKISVFSLAFTYQAWWLVAVSGKFLSLLTDKEGREGNTLKTTVMNRTELSFTLLLLHINININDTIIMINRPSYYNTCLFNVHPIEYQVTQ